MMSIHLGSDTIELEPSIDVVQQHQLHFSGTHNLLLVKENLQSIRMNNSTSMENMNPQSSTHTLEDKTSKDNLKVAIYMTTHLDKMQTAFLKKCWPLSTQHLSLLSNADLILYTSGNPSQELLKNLNFTSIQVRKYREPAVHSSTSWKQKNRLKQAGAKRAMLDPFPKHDNESSWFASYDWVIRLNADVLLRRDDWLLETIHNDTVDGIFVTCPLTSTNPSVRKLHSDFLAFRPSAVNHTLLWEHARIQNAEEHLTKSFQHILESKRYTLVPGTRANSVVCRTSGVLSPVVHNHQALSKCQNFYKS